MQFKRAGRRIQVIAYRGYDREKGRAITKMLGSIDGHTYEPTVGLTDSMTVEEIDELTRYIETQKQGQELERLEHAARYAPLRLNTLAKAIEQADQFQPPIVTATWTEQTWAAIDAVTKALRNAGCPRPRKSATRPPDEAAPPAVKAQPQAVLELEPSRPRGQPGTKARP